MSVTEMKQFIAENVGRVEDASKLEQMVHLIEDARPEVSVKEIWAEITSRHDGLMKRLAQ